MSKCEIVQFNNNKYAIRKGNKNNYEYKSLYYANAWWNTQSTIEKYCQTDDIKKLKIDLHLENNADVGIPIAIKLKVLKKWFKDLIINS